MSRYLELITIKSKSESDQKRIISDVVGSISPTEDLGPLRKLAAAEFPGASNLSDEALVTLWILVFYASDLATVPLRESRDYHLVNLAALSAAYNLPERPIRRLSVHGDFAMRWFDEKLSQKP